VNRYVTVNARGIPRRGPRDDPARDAAGGCDGSPPAAEILRTEDVTDADRFARWRHWVSATFVPLECAPVIREPFRGTLARWELGGLHVSHVSADPHLAARTRQLIARQDRDCDFYKVGLLTGGSCQLSQNGRQTTLLPGDLASYDCRRPYTMHFRERFEMSFLMFGCHRLRLPQGAIESVLVSRVPSTESTGSLVAPFLRRLVANLELRPDAVNGRLADNVLDLLATLFGERSGGEPADPAVLRRSLLLQVCHDEGTSVARWVRERRLDNCRRDLEDPAHAERQVAAIARRWGFADPAHFSKIFKASYGEPPGQYRHRA
jgi:AraC-like DNA-binding protein